MKSYSLGEHLSFTGNGRGRVFLEHGWSGPEISHCWSDGKSASMQFPLDEQPAGEIGLYIRCSGYEPTPDYGPQEIVVSVAETPLAKWKAGNREWHSTTIPGSLISGKHVQLKFDIPKAASPAGWGRSTDTRLLGMDVDSMVMFALPDLTSPAQKITAGHDPIGDLFRVSGCYHRAVRKVSTTFFKQLWDLGIYDALAKRQLIPQHFISEIHHADYSFLVSAASGRFVFPAKYPWRMLLDAAKVWVEINEALLELSPKKELGLCDGHYGNFIQCEGSTPKWCDIGSIAETESGLQFGYGEFVRCYMFPLLMSTRSDLKDMNIRQLMALNPQGIPNDIYFHDGNAALDSGFPLSYENGARREALACLRRTLESLQMPAHGGYWSNYRSSEALAAAWGGQLLYSGQDSRFAAVLDQVRRSGATSFIDIGCNDGIFSLLCAREGLKGLAMDIDEDSLNKLYGFVKGRPDANLAISYGGFLDVEDQAELVLALALTHHLALSQKMDFDRIARKLADMTKNQVITEFMPDGLGGTPHHPRPLPDPLPDYYRLDNFVAALKKEFTGVEVVDYERKSDPAHFSRRVLIVCNK